VNEALVGAVERFIDELAPIVEALGSGVAAVRADRLAGDVALEVFDLACALVDADGLHTDNELWALIATFGPRLESQLGHADPAALRRAGIVTGRRRWVEQPSPLLELVLAADRRDGTSTSWTYYARAMAVAHEVAAIDAHVARLELVALEQLRSTLLRSIAEHGIPRPGTPPDAARGPVVPPPAGATTHQGSSSVADLPLPPLAPARPLEELHAELDALIGLDVVKAEVKLVADLLVVQRLRTERGLPVAAGSRHLVFTGNPGTGKTTVARLLAELYRTLGVVTRGHLVETDRGGLVAGYVGQTATKVKGVFTSAIGGVLLIDEAYALARGGERDFGAEAIDTLVKLVEDHRDEIVVILAGYPAEMAELVASNPGIESRFPRTIHFPDYTDDELVQIFDRLCRAAHYEPDEAALAAARDRFSVEPRGPGFGNGRLARNLFEASIAAQASRIVAMGEPTDADLGALTAPDVVAAAARI
jgi:Cdc6-like AAA superfamily ATPase